MIITLDPRISVEQRTALLRFLSGIASTQTEVSTQQGAYIVATPKSEFDLRVIGNLPGVRDVHRVSDAYKLVSRKWKASRTAINLGDGVKIEEGGLALIAGPCSIENEDQVRQVVRHLQEAGLQIMRGGAFKPRSSPYSFRGLGLDGLKMFHDVAAQGGIKVVTEVLSVQQIEPMYDYVDMFQVGTRNSQNFELLLELGQVDKPVLLKRGMSGTLEELLQSAEYIFANGNERIVLCERGIRTFERSYRNMLDLNAVPALKEKTHLPVIVDPSHGVGVRRWVEPLGLAAIMAGADGIIYEAQALPEKALSDGQQTLNFTESAAFVEKARKTFELRKSFA